MRRIQFSLLAASGAAFAWLAYAATYRLFSPGSLQTVAAFGRPIVIGMSAYGSILSLYWLSLHDPDRARTRRILESAFVVVIAIGVVGTLADLFEEVIHVFELVPILIMSVAVGVVGGLFGLLVFDLKGDFRSILRDGMFSSRSRRTDRAGDDR